MSTAYSYIFTFYAPKNFTPIGEEFTEEDGRNMRAFIALLETKKLALTRNEIIATNSVTYTQFNLNTRGTLLTSENGEFRPAPEGEFLPDEDRRRNPHYGHPERLLKSITLKLGEVIIAETFPVIADNHLYSAVTELMNIEPMVDTDIAHHGNVPRAHSEIAQKEYKEYQDFLTALCSSINTWPTRRILLSWFAAKNNDIKRLFATQLATLTAKPYTSPDSFNELFSLLKSTYDALRRRGSVRCLQALKQFCRQYDIDLTQSSEALVQQINRQGLPLAESTAIAVDDVALSKSTRVSPSLRGGGGAAAGGH